MARRAKAPEAIVVHHLVHVRAALAAAEAAGKLVHLLTPPGGADYAGAAFYAEIVRIAAAERPAATYRLTLDCGDDAALAIDALAAGWTSLVLAARPKARAKVGDIASRFGATVSRSRPTALDLATSDDPEAACRALLAAT
jgi:hypothetical protein